MRYLITFFEGMITFVSPCILPMLPVYILYFAGSTAEGEKEGKSRTFRNACGFVLGFALLFMALGVFASVLNSLLVKHSTAVNIVTGLVVVVFGLHYTGLLKIGFLNKTLKLENKVKPTGFFSALLFGAVFAVGWTPCTGAFLGSALMMASQQQKAASGCLLLLCYSLGLGVPFVLCALLVDSLKKAFDFIKNHYRAINLICGIFLIAVGILMMTGVFSGVLLKLR